MAEKRSPITVTTTSFGERVRQQLDNVLKISERRAEMSASWARLKAKINYIMTGGKERRMVLEDVEMTRFVDRDRAETEKKYK